MLRRAELDDRASRLAAGLSGLGLGPGSKVAILAHNGPEYLEAVFAAYKLRGSPVNLNDRYREDELVEVAVVAVVALRTGAVCTEADVQASVRARLAGYKVPRRVIFVDEIRRSPSGKVQHAWARDVAARAATASR